MIARRVLQASLVIVLAALFRPTALSADPVTLQVNGARVYVVDSSDPVKTVNWWHQTSTVEGARFDVIISGNLLDSRAILDLCRSCNSGETFNPSIVLSGDPFATVTVLLPDRFNDLAASGELTLQAGSITLPADAPELFNVFLPLTLSGFLSASSNGAMVIRVQPFSFTGTAFVQFRTSPGPSGTRVFNAQWFDYTGSDGTAPVPEPGSMILLGTGLTALMLRARRGLRRIDRTRTH